MSAQLTWRVIDEADNARTAANRPTFAPQTLTFSAQVFILIALYLESGIIAGIFGSKKRFRLRKAM